MLYTIVFFYFILYLRSEQDSVFHQAHLVIQNKIAGTESDVTAETEQARAVIQEKTKATEGDVTSAADQAHIVSIACHATKPQLARVQTTCQNQKQFDGLKRACEAGSTSKVLIDG
jgi:hypothetical protein